MNQLCPICKKEKNNVGPKSMGSKYVDPESPFTQKQLVVDWVIMCNGCLVKVKSGEVVINKQVSRKSEILRRLSILQAQKEKYIVTKPLQDAENPKSRSLEEMREYKKIKEEERSLLKELDEDRIK